MDKTTKLLPLIPLRGMNIFPYMVLHFDVGREKSILALENAMLNNQEIFLVSQKVSKIEEPEEKDIYEIGTICNVKQILKLPGDSIRVLVEGMQRGKISEYKDKEPFVSVEVELIYDEQSVDDKKCKAYIRLIDKAFEEYINLSVNSFPDALFSLEETEEPGRYCDIVSSYLILKPQTKQELLEILDVTKRLEKLLLILKNELEVLKIEKKIGTKVKDKIDKIQKEYYLREQVKAIQEELGEDDENKKEIIEYEIKIKKAKLPKEPKEKANYELNRLKSSGNYSAESGVSKSYLDWILALPWNKSTKDNIDISKAREVFDKEHYGLEDVKERIIEYLAVKKISKTLKGPILCLVGPPGVGKTSIAKSVANALNRNFVRMSLGGVKDEAEIRGHRKTYVGAIPGRIIYAMKQAGSKNPLFLLDEIDKMSGDIKGDPADALLEVLDSEQNASFRDHYLELDFDLSKVLFITTANKLDTIPRALLDRMEVIEVSGYTSEEKFHIAKNHIIPKMLKEHNMDDSKITFSDNSITCIIENYTRESGVRSLERQIASVIRKAITEMVEKNKKSVNVTASHVKRYLGAVMFTYDKAETEDKVGVVTGLAWTEVGGVTLPVEASAMEGTGKLELTGQLGDVMKESAKAGYSYVRANAFKYNIDKDFYKNKDIHIHVPEGSVPKDGPSAGVTMITAMVSALTNRKVRHNVAMTGEITLTGRVLPIGGLKEKSLAAYRAGVDTIIIPCENEKDTEKIPKSIKDKLKFIFASKVENVLEHALLENTLNGEINNGDKTI
ncbi:endopeptidase La [Clostridium estertheticum]|uniref:Lon protease n=1 Tax=Clostridium estertheticum TaxID=238834 RepID=A0A7Y3SZL6_9CLOT|nr:endopeptidase La [Clostridium estertheticum]MBW9173724.1 endopeptidase La [Clostridium estertheticum]MBX4270649.1 endopeptidase La [Clostridium estertheticum]NNU77407.1 endopeptidase La [Clostridium estertheticum]WBL47138.1 endopeptidase La [Clostridium estertheticum]WLC75317.1 endopeptidase La [Clostridium estertheticum]